MKFYTKDFFSKCDQICRKLGIWKLSHLLRKSLTKNCSAVWCSATLLQWTLPWRKNSGYKNIPKDRSSRLEVFCKEGVLSSKKTFVLRNTSGGCFRKELPRTLKSLDMISKERRQSKISLKESRIIFFDIKKDANIFCRFFSN